MSDGNGDGVELSERECEIVLLLADGYTNVEIADELALSRRTVDWYRARLRDKLGVTRRSELVRFAREQLGWPDARRQA